MFCGCFESLAKDANDATRSARNPYIIPAIRQLLYCAAMTPCLVSPCPIVKTQSLRNNKLNSLVPKSKNTTPSISVVAAPLRVCVASRTRCVSFLCGVYYMRIAQIVGSRLFFLFSTTVFFAQPLGCQGARQQQQQTGGELELRRPELKENVRKMFYYVLKRELSRRKVCRHKTPNNVMRVCGTQQMWKEILGVSTLKHTYRRIKTQNHRQSAKQYK